MTNEHICFVIKRSKVYLRFRIQLS